MAKWWAAPTYKNHQPFSHRHRLGVVEELANGFAGVVVLDDRVVIRAVDPEFLFGALASWKRFRAVLEFDDLVRRPMNRPSPVAARRLERVCPE